MNKILKSSLLAISLVAMSASSMLAGYEQAVSALQNCPTVSSTFSCFREEILEINARYDYELKNIVADKEKLNSICNGTPTRGLGRLHALNIQELEANREAEIKNLGKNRRALRKLIDLKKEDSGNN